MSEYLYYKVECTESDYNSSSLGTEDEAKRLAHFLIDHTSKGNTFDIVGYSQGGVPTVEFSIHRESPKQELKRLEKAFHYQECLEEPWG